MDYKIDSKKEKKNVLETIKKESEFTEEDMDHPKCCQ